MSDGKLTKMVIVGYKDPKFKSMIGGRDESTFTMQINPSEYSFNYGTVANNPTILANSAQQDKSNLLDIRRLTLNFFLDSTGVVPDCDDVSAAITKFKSICVDINGSIHTTNFLKIYWAKGLAFPCKLDSVSIKYLMFSPNGMPLRAEISATFKEFVDPETAAALAKTNSPDMSHMRIVEAGDNLPAMCNDIYGDPGYYLQIAEINSIINFRKLKPGSQILFPRMLK